MVISGLSGVFILKASIDVWINFKKLTKAVGKLDARRLQVTLEIKSFYVVLTSLAFVLCSCRKIGNS